MLRAGWELLADRRRPICGVGRPNSGQAEAAIPSQACHACLGGELTQCQGTMAVVADSFLCNSLVTVHFKLAHNALQTLLKIEHHKPAAASQA